MNHVFYINSEDTIHFSNTVTKTVNLSILVGKVPGISAKTVHFPPRPAGAPAPQASLAPLGISISGESAGFSCENGSLSLVARMGTGSTDISGGTRHSLPRESAGNFRENGSLSPAAGRGTGSTGLSRATWHFHLRGKCRVFPRKRFTFPRGRQGHRLHRPLSPHLPFPPPVGKVPGFPAKTVHFPPRPAGAPAPQTSLVALGISTSGESAGLSGENGSLSPVADKGTGSTGLSRRTCRFHLQGKCRVFPRKRFTFPRGRQGYRLHRPLWPHLQSLPPGKVPDFLAKMVHFPPCGENENPATRKD